MSVDLKVLERNYALAARAVKVAEATHQDTWEDYEAAGQAVRDARVLALAAEEELLTAVEAAA